VVELFRAIGGDVEARFSRTIAMRLPRVRFTVRRMMVAVVIMSLIIACIIELERRRQKILRDRAIQSALLASSPPPAWWPPEWRQELETRFTIEGDVTVAGKKVGAGTVFFILQPENRRFPAKIRNGRYSLTHDRMPTGSYRIEVRSEDGPAPQTSKSQWKMPMDQGLHRMNLAF
jgi:hypothetical protein